MQNCNGSSRQDPNTISDPRIPLQNLSMLRTRMDSLHHFLSQSIYTHTLLTKDHMNTVSNEIVSSIHQLIQNGTVLVSYSQNLESKAKIADFKVEMLDDEEDEAKATDNGEDCEIVELLAENVHFCQICGKGFRRDANLRIHMRAHGYRFKTPATRFSCPFQGCNRNKSHRKNHFKRSHCPKMYSCNRCHKKNFSVLSDLKSHMKHCGTTFSSKDQLFGHIGLFEGHMPALALDEQEEKRKEEDEGFGVNSVNCLDDELPEGFFDDLEEFESIGKYSHFPEALGFPNNNVTLGGLT